MIAGIIAEAARLLTGAHARWRGCAPEKKLRVYFANHTSNLDFVLLWAALPRALRDVTRPVAAHDYWTKSALRLAMAERVFRAVLIER
jgi:1-acyl-sn-glycerol-3-phosphate acyltransferase